MTATFHKMKKGGKVGIRGPYGNWWPYKTIKGKNITGVNDRIILAAVSNILSYILDNRSDYKKIK